MSESAPGVIVIALLFLLTGVIFMFLGNTWVEHNTLQNEVAAFQEAKVDTRLDITNAELSPDYCPDYTGPYVATIENNGLTSITDFAQTDVFVDYLDAGDNKLESLLQYGSDWTLSSLVPDERDPNQWDPAETATITFPLSPGLKPDTNGVFTIASPQGISDSKYFTCPTECSGVTGFMSPTSESADTGGNGDGFEVTPTNAFADDGSPASSVTVIASGDNHRFYNYGFSIHPACEIKGIEVRIDWWLLNILGSNSMSVELSWDGGSSWTAAKTDSVESLSEHTTVLGSDSDTWGHTWSPSELNNANFRVRVTTNNTLSQSFFLDWVPVNVYYAPP